MKTCAEGIQSFIFFNVKNSVKMRELILFVLLIFSKKLVNTKRWWKFHKKKNISYRGVTLKSLNENVNQISH
jgi:hypothetical protein